MCDLQLVTVLDTCEDLPHDVSHLSLGDISAFVHDVGQIPSTTEFGHEIQVAVVLIKFVQP